MVSRIIIGSKSIHFLVICSQLSIFLGDLLQLIPLETLFLLAAILSKANCKQFGPRSGQTCQSWSGSKPFDTLIVFQKEFFEKVSFDKSEQTTTAYNV